MRIVRSFLLLAMLVVNTASFGEVITFTDTGRISTTTGSQFYLTFDIRGLSYERITTVDTGTPGATYEDSGLPYDNSGYYERSLTGGAIGISRHSVPRSASPSFVSYTLTVFDANGLPLFSVAGDGQYNSAILLRHRPGANTAQNLVVQGSSPANLGDYTKVHTGAQLTLENTSFALPPDGHFISPGVYLVDPPNDGANAMTQYHFVPQPDGSWLQINDLRAVFVPDQVTVSIGTVPEQSTYFMLSIGLLVLTLYGKRVGKVLNRRLAVVLE